MALLCDLYVSTPERAVLYDERQDAPDSERARLTSLTFLEFSTLWAIIQRQPWTDAHLLAFEGVLESEGGERHIHRFPAEFVAAAAALAAADAATAAGKWAQTEELRCTVPEARHVIDELCRVAGIAQRDGRALYLWTCL